VTRLPSLGRRGEGWLVIQVLLLTAIVLAGLFGAGPRGPQSWLPTSIGAVLLVAGLILGVRGLRDLGAAMSPFPRPLAGTRIVRTGVYRHVRHPIYGGIILAAFGWAMVMASPTAVILAVVLLFFFELKARREEVWLYEQDEEYAQYRASTRRFIPGIL
jgi:protein-S-isoprenylcysteine O-methyltransferase Ste14